MRELKAALPTAPVGDSVDNIAMAPNEGATA